MLRERLDIRVPPCAIVTAEDGASLLFASRKLPYRWPVEFALRAGMVANPELLHDIAAFDIWTANADRNVNNLLMDHDGSRLWLVAIDFEKVEVLAGRRDRFAIMAIHPREFLRDNS